MEPASLAVSIVGLAGLFSTCIEGLEYVQLGKQFGKDYGKCLLRVDASKLRLSRWAESVGLMHPESAERYKASLSQDEYKLVQNLLEQIRDSLQDAKENSTRYEKRIKTKDPETTSLAVYDPVNDLAPQFQNLHLTLRTQAAQRQMGASFLTKAKWALYEKKKFDNMIEEINDSIAELVDMFPATLEDQKASSKQEIQGLEETQDLALLKEVAQDDEILMDAVKDLAEQRGHSFQDLVFTGSSVHAGDINEAGVAGKGHSYTRINVSDRSKVHLGNVNRGRG